MVYNGTGLGRIMVSTALLSSIILRIGRIQSETGCILLMPILKLTYVNLFWNWYSVEFKPTREKTTMKPFQSPIRGCEIGISIWEINICQFLSEKSTYVDLLKWSYLCRLQALLLDEIDICRFLIVVTNSSLWQWSHVIDVSALCLRQILILKTTNKKSG